jgi:DUF4097 and DUF4098 domain-containing protein YvlB
MSTTPPNTPPNGAPPPFPPYDPKSQWRTYREQQKAAWHAQRDAWKAQQHAWKANYIGTYGPRVPSVVGPVILIGVGVVALLVLTGYIPSLQFWSWYGHWWPLLLIGAGLALLGEWALDLRRAVPVRRGGNFVGLIILLAILGFCASGWNNSRPWFAEWGDHNGDFFNAFGLPEHDFDQKLNAQIPANAAIDIENPRGDVSITAGDVSTVDVQAHEVAYASSDADAKKIFDAEAAQLKVSGSAVQIRSESNSNGKLNLVVTVPKSARVTVNAGRGDISAADLGAGINVTVSHGGVDLNTLKGPVQVHFSKDKGDFAVHQVEGDITADGRYSDVNLTDVQGKVALSGEIIGDVYIKNISAAVHLHTSVTDLQVAALPGDLTLNSDSLRLNEARGQVRVTTHSKDVDLSQIYGDSYVENRDGSISVEPAGAFGVEAKNSKGDVEITLPPEASAIVNGYAHNGEISTEFALPVTGEENKTVTGRIGSGKSKIVLNADNGDVHIKKGSGFSSAPTAAAPAAHKAAAPPNARHLKAPKALPAQPVTQ